MYSGRAGRKLEATSGHALPGLASSTDRVFLTLVNRGAIDSEAVILPTFVARWPWPIHQLHMRNQQRGQTGRRCRRTWCKNPLGFLAPPPSKRGCDVVVEHPCGWSSQQSWSILFNSLRGGLPIGEHAQPLKRPVRNPPASQSRISLAVVWVGLHALRRRALEDEPRKQRLITLCIGVVH
jgi:hypothetical protein